MMQVEREGDILVFNIKHGSCEICLTWKPTICDEHLISCWRISSLCLLRGNPVTRDFEMSTDHTGGSNDNSLCANKCSRGRLIDQILFKFRLCTENGE